jgi:hypothetical protein
VIEVSLCNISLAAISNSPAGNFTLSLSFESIVKTDPTRKMNEKVKIAFPYPPRKKTSAPMKNTTVAVNNLPTLKQNPVADALTAVGNNEGIYTDKAPWLIAK